MALEVDAEPQQLLRVGLSSGDERARHEPERHGRGARAEAALARDPVGEREGEPSAGASRANARTARWSAIGLVLRQPNPRGR